ncbi:3'-5' exoribonuclease YhaM family protein [Peredibacter starrii]|uniref:OB-fold nucleic acid binding domain-containing protein n=1 Tax=Peredibacter starrii TaxID=28202 RepID=A0AAX4HPJ5_9BACT|nr:HD domain-containing protein [Peredibacter starrii]WPU64884.1 OB-fold nucleic acid binding domain-containing protein [Peredibacter starrii]
MTKLFISDLQGKEEIESVFLVKIFNVMEGKDGKKYFNIILTDSTGEMEARLWHYSAEIEKNISKGTFVKVRGKVNFYQGRKQFIIAHIEKVEQNDVSLDDFVMKAVEDPEVMYKKLLNIVDGLTDVYIRDLLRNIITDGEIARRLKIWQAGKSIHHAYRSGLLEHILSCTELALHLSKHYKVNENYVVAGCILHDICKIYELTDGVNVEYTEEGKLVGHLVKGLEIVDRFSYKIKNFPHYTKMHIKHILLAHHGEYEYGSPKIPQTSEAYLVHLIDLMDSKMGSFDIIRKTDNNTGHWSGFVKHLDRIVYKSELPFYPEYIQEEEHHHEERQERPEPKREAPKPQRGQPEPKTSLGNMLSGFKVDKP